MAIPPIKLKPLVIIRKKADLSILVITSFHFPVFYFAKASCFVYKLLCVQASMWHRFCV